MFFPATRMRFIAKRGHLRAEGCLYKWKIYCGKKIVATCSRKSVFDGLKMEWHPNMYTGKYDHVKCTLDDIEASCCEPKDYHFEPHGY